jgi:hypothetical protein
MTVRNISIAAYEKHIESGKQASQWMRIYEYLGTHSPRTRSELSEYAGIRLSSVCGRVNELIKAKLVIEDARRECRVTGEPAHTVTLKNQIVDPRQSGLFD